MFVREKLEHLVVRYSLNFYQDELDPAEHTNNAGGWERRAELWRSARRQQFIIKVSSWRFYNWQEEVLNQKSPKVIDRFVFAVDNAGQKADNKHTGTMIFPFFLLVSKTDKPLRDHTFKNQSLNSCDDRPFTSYGSLTAFFYSPFKQKLMPYKHKQLSLIFQTCFDGTSVTFSVTYFEIAAAFKARAILQSSLHCVVNIAY